MHFCIEYSNIQYEVGIISKDYTKKIALIDVTVIVPHYSPFNYKNYK